MEHPNRSFRWFILGGSLTMDYSCLERFLLVPCWSVQFFGSSPCAQIEVLVVGKDSKDGDIKMHSIHMPENELVSYKEDGVILYPKFTNQQSKYYDPNAQEKLKNLQTRANMHDLAKKTRAVDYLKRLQNADETIATRRQRGDRERLRSKLTEQNARNLY